MTSTDLTSELTEAEALKLTAEIKAWAGTLWQKLKQAHDGKAWKAMGYGSWTEYLSTEFDVSRSRGYQLVAHANAIAELADAAGVEVSTMVDTSERITRGLDLASTAEEVRRQVAVLPQDATDDERAAVTRRVVNFRRAPQPVAPRATDVGVSGDACYSPAETQVILRGVPHIVAVLDHLREHGHEVRVYDIIALFVIRRAEASSLTSEQTELILAELERLEAADEGSGGVGSVVR